MTEQETSDRLMVLHGLRLKGFAIANAVATTFDLDVDTVIAELDLCRADGLVVERNGPRPGWTLTTEGRKAGETLLALELDRHGARASVQQAYHRFVDMNHRLLAVFTRWQVRQTDPVVLNDHRDARYDAGVVADLKQLDAEIGAICGDLTSALARFGRYRAVLSAALRRVERGDKDWLTKPTILSYHTIIFELHEDLLATLGLDRASETARLNGSAEAQSGR